MVYRQIWFTYVSYSEELFNSVLEYKSYWGSVFEAFKFEYEITSGVSLYTSITVAEVWWIMSVSITILYYMSLTVFRFLLSFMCPSKWTINAMHHTFQWVNYSAHQLCLYIS